MNNFSCILHMRRKITILNFIFVDCVRTSLPMCHSNVINLNLVEVFLILWLLLPSCRQSVIHRPYFDALVIQLSVLSSRPIRRQCVSTEYGVPLIHLMSFFGRKVNFSLLKRFWVIDSFYFCKSLIGRLIRKKNFKQTVYLFFILRHIFQNMKAKSSSQIGPFFYLMFANWVRLFTCLNFFRSNFSKFAVECDLKSKISQNAQNLIFF